MNSIDQPNQSQNIGQYYTDQLHQSLNISILDQLNQSLNIEKYIHHQYQTLSMEYALTPTDWVIVKQPSRFFKKEEVFCW